MKHTAYIYIGKQHISTKAVGVWHEANLLYRNLILTSTSRTIVLVGSRKRSCSMLVS